MADAEAPLKDGDRLRDWEGELLTARNVSPALSGYHWYFDAKYDNGREVPNYVWHEPDFTHVTEESN